MIRDAAVYLMNNLVLTPAGWEPFTTSQDLHHEGWIDQVPTGPGVYVIYTPSHFYTLPGGGTSVLYIGRGTSGEGLRKRLREHQRFAREVRDGEWDRGYARYEWMVAHPARVSFVVERGSVLNATGMERKLLLTFADAYRVAPIGNAQSAWAKASEVIDEAVGAE